MNSANSDKNDRQASGDGQNVATVASVGRALRILRCFTTDNTTLGVTEIARTLQMYKSTTHRLLVTLEREQFLYQVEPGRYALSYTIVELAAAVANTGGVRQVVLDHLSELVEQTGETAHLAVLDGGQVLYLEKVEGTWSLRMPSAVGRRVPVNCTALGKVLLSGISPDELDKVVRSQVWVSATAHTITDPDRLIEVVGETRSNGYAVDLEEIEIGLMCIAAPVVDDAGAVCAGVSISGPRSRVEANLDSYVENVKDVAAAVSRQLGPRARHLGGGRVWSA